VIFCWYGFGRILTDWTGSEDNFASMRLDPERLFAAVIA
jgi:hypothetical protein